ncbi:MAG: ArnT family glycosyltransferase [Chloroflexota bacterium]
MKGLPEVIPTVIGACIVAIAAILRLGWLDLAPYQYDEADVLLRVFDMQRGLIPLTGAMTSWGVPDPPMMVYLVAIVAWLPHPALAAAGLVAALNVLAVAVTYIATYRHFGFWVALATGLLFAVNPWAIYFGRRFWTEILPVFPAVAFWAALEITQRRDPRWLPVLGAALATQIQARLLGALYLPAAAISVLPMAYRWGRPVAVTLGISLLISMPFIIYVAQSFGDITRALRDGSRGLSTTANTGLLDLVRWTISGEHLLPFGNRGLIEFQALGRAVETVGVLTAAMLVGGTLVILVETARRKAGWTRFPILLLWAVTPIGVLAAQTSSLYVHYLVVLSPFPFLMMGLMVGWALAGGTVHTEVGVRPGSVAGPLLRVLGAVVLLAIVSVQTIVTLSLYSTLRIFDVRNDERAAPPAQPQAPAAQLASSAPRETAQALGTGETYGIEIPLRYWLDVRSVAQRLAREMGIREILVLTDGTQPLAEERPALVEGMIGPEHYGRYLTPLSLAIPLGREALVLETWATDPAEPFQRLGERLETVPLPTSSRTARDATRFYRLPARSASEWASLTDRPLDGLLGGVRLVGARGPERVRPGESIQLVTYWTVDPTVPPSADVVSVRLIDERGQPSGSQALELSQDVYDSAEPLGLVLRHDFTVGARSTPGVYRFEVAAGGSAVVATTTDVVAR